MRLLNTLKYKYYNIKISCKNLFNQFNIIWNNREYEIFSFYSGEILNGEKG